MRRTRLYVPVFTLLAVVLLLLIVLGVSTVRNLNRDRLRMEEALFSDGLIVLRSLEATFRTGMRGMWSGEDNLQWLMSQMSDVTDLRFVGLVDEHGTVIAHTDEQLVGSAYPEFQQRKVATAGGRPVGWFAPEGDFVMAKPFRPVRRPPGSGGMWGGMRGMMRPPPGFEPIIAGKIYAVVGLDTGKYQEARRKDVRHAVLMGVILLVLGSAGLYFMVVLQNYYVVNRTLKTMTTYADNVVDNMPDGLISLDASGDVRTVNQRAREIFNLGVGADDRRTLTRRLASFAQPLRETLRNTRRIVEQEIEWVRDDEVRVPLAVSAARLVSDEGEELGAVFIVRDLREMRDLQERVQRSERLAALGSLAAGVAHEIRNPLSSIKGFAQFFLKKSPPESKEHDYSEVMISEVDRLNRVIANLLDFARPKDPTIGPVPLKDLVNHSVELVSAEARSGKVGMAVELSDSLPTVEVDRDQITQVLLNIMLNGLDAMEEGGKLTVRCAGDEGKAVIEVRDTGGGIPEADLSRIFDPFFSTKKKGTGLGLAIAQRIIDNHHGTITVTSAPGEGTTFRIELPVQPETRHG